MKEPPYGMVVPTVYGPMIVNRYDINQTNALVKTGKAIDHEEIQLLRQCLSTESENKNFIDAGANFGTYSLGIARDLAPEGKVYAFEAQRILFNMLAGSIALNGLQNVHCFNVALGNEAGMLEVPLFDYCRPLNFGSIEFGPEQREKLSQERRRDTDFAEKVTLSPLDHFAFENIGAIKIDVEGMEIAVFDGAIETIRRWRPFLYIEVLKSDAKVLRKKLKSLDYQVLVYKGMNLFGIPAEKRERLERAVGS